MDANLAGSRPSISAALSSKKMDLRSFMGKGGEAAKPTGKPGKEAPTSMGAEVRQRNQPENLKRKLARQRQKENGCSRMIHFLWTV